MEFLIDELIKDTRGAFSVSKIPTARLETYIANELIDEQGNLLIDLPKPIYYSKSVKDSIYRWNTKNREKLNTSRRDYHRKRCAEEPGYLEHHNAKCRAYNQRVLERKRANRILDAKKSIEKKRSEAAKNISYKITENEKSQIETMGFYTMSFD